MLRNPADGSLGERDVQVVSEACGEAVRLVNLGRLGGRVDSPEPLAEKEVLVRGLEGAGDLEPCPPSDTG